MMGMKSRPGFTLMEVVIATAIASVISVLLLQSISQINRTRSQLENRISLYSRAAIVQQQLERDLSGALSFTERDWKAPEGAAQSGDEKEPEGPPTFKLKNGKNSENQIYPPSLFVASTRDGMLDELTFFTCNPLQQYWGPKAGRPRPRIARVTYRLVPEKNGTEKSYALTRQEDAFPASGAASDIESGANNRVYTLARGIRDLSINYGWVEYDTSDPSSLVGSSDETKPVEGSLSARTYQYHTAPDWTVPERPPGDKDEYNPRPVIPSFFSLRANFWNTAHSNATPLTLMIGSGAYYTGARASAQEHERTETARKKKSLASKTKESASAGAVTPKASP